MHADSAAGFGLLIGRARVSDPILLNERAMARMVAQVQWVLRRVGADGIRLTRAGHLPPAVVVEASTEIEWDWPIEVNREAHLRPLQELRTHMRDVGLLRVSKGMLLQTVKGRALAESPRELWWHLARTVHQSRDRAVVDATRLLLLLIATRSLEKCDDYMEILAGSLETLGWAQSDFSAPTAHSAWAAVAGKWRLLTRLGVFEPSDHERGTWGTATAAGAAFARAALRTEATNASAPVARA